MSVFDRKAILTIILQLSHAMMITIWIRNGVWGHWLNSTMSMFVFKILSQIQSLFQRNFNWCESSSYTRISFLSLKSHNISNLNFRAAPNICNWLWHGTFISLVQSFSEFNDIIRNNARLWRDPYTNPHKTIPKLWAALRFCWENNSRKSSLLWRESFLLE